MDKNNSMSSQSRRSWINPTWKQKQNIGWSGFICLAILFSYISLAMGLHCHRKHDHSTDVLLMGRSNEDLLLARGAYNIQPQKLVASQYVDNDATQRTDTRHRHKSSSRKSTNEGNHGNRNRATKQSLSHSPQISMTFCPEKCNCGFKNHTNQLEVICNGYFGDNNFPIDKLRKDVEILSIVPTSSKCVNVGSNGETRCDLVENQLTLGPIYKQLRLLKTLTITHSNIPNIGRRTMWGLSGLKTLNLSHNKLTNVIDQNFEGLYSLTHLVLDDNLIKSMVSAAFRHIPQLETLSLRQNLIEELAPRVFYKLRNLKTLDLSKNHLQFLSGAVFADVPNLESLICESCGVFQLRLPYSTYLKKLSTLRLMNNTIHEFRDIQSSLYNSLRHLDLSQNRLTKVQVETFHDSRRLHVLKLSGNNISEIDNCAFCNTTLEELDISSNAMTDINENMFSWNTRSMKTLDLENNWLKMENIDALFRKLPNLEDVNLSSSRLVTIPTSIFETNPRIKHFNVSDNYLISIQVGVFNHLHSLESLDLSSNYFMDLSEEFFSEVRRKKTLKMIYLQNNRFVCDKCHIIPLKEWLDSSLQYWGSCFPKSNPMCLKCSTPDEYLHLPIEDLPDNDELPECNTEILAPDLPPYNGNGFLSQDLHRINGYDKDYSGSNNGIWMLNTNSPYLAGGLAAVLLLVLVLVLLTKYRHYGVYLTHEDDDQLFHTGHEDDNLDILRNPVIVLDKNAESYINLRYPTLSQHDLDKKC